MVLALESMADDISNEDQYSLMSESVLSEGGKLLSEDGCPFRTWICYPNGYIL